MCCGYVQNFPAFFLYFRQSTCGFGLSTAVVYIYRLRFSV